MLTAQSKKDLEKSLNQEKAMADSLRKELAVSHHILDSIAATQLLSPGQGGEFESFYKYVYGKYLKPFVPINKADLTMAEATALLDSVVAVRSAKLSNLETTGRSSQDTLNALLIQNQQLRTRLEVAGQATAEAFGLDQAPINEADLMGKWNLYLVPLGIIGDSSQSAIISLNQLDLPDSVFHKLNTQIPRAVTFGEKDLAEVTFLGGITTNAFYKVVGFSRTKPFYIDFNRGEDLKIRMYAVYTSKGLQISAELPRAGSAGRFLFGYMKR